jgi:hypothetical protein
MIELTEEPWRALGASAAAAMAQTVDRTAYKRTNLSPRPCIIPCTGVSSPVIGSQLAGLVLSHEEGYCRNAASVVRIPDDIDILECHERSYYQR